MPDLNKIKQKNAFKLPEDYFSTFEESLMHKVSVKNEREEYSLFDRLVYQLQLRFTVPSLMVSILALVVIYISLDQNEEMITFSDNQLFDYLIEEYDDELESEILSTALAYNDEALIMDDQEIINYLSDQENDFEGDILDELIVE